MTRENAIAKYENTDIRSFNIWKKTTHTSTASRLILLKIHVDEINMKEDKWGISEMQVSLKWSL